VTSGDASSCHGLSRPDSVCSARTFRCPDLLSGLARAPAICCALSSGLRPGQRAREERNAAHRPVFVVSDASVVVRVRIGRKSGLPSAWFVNGEGDVENQQQHDRDRDERDAQARRFVNHDRSARALRSTMDQFLGALIMSGVRAGRS
jgi:hypothetical protein